MQTVNELMEATFFEGRDPRSAEYKEGVRDFLLSRVEGGSLAPIPHELGTAQADAYLAGREEGQIIWRTLARAEVLTK